MEFDIKTRLKTRLICDVKRIRNVMQIEIWVEIEIDKDIKKYGNRDIKIEIIEKFKDVKKIERKKM